MLDIEKLDAAQFAEQGVDDARDGGVDDADAVGALFLGTEALVEDAAQDQLGGVGGAQDELGFGEEAGERLQAVSLGAQALGDLLGFFHRAVDDPEPGRLALGDGARGHLADLARPDDQADLAAQGAQDVFALDYRRLAGAERADVEVGLGADLFADAVGSLDEAVQVGAAAAGGAGELEGLLDLLLDLV